MNSLVDLVYTPLEEWDEVARSAFAEALAPRYQRVQESSVKDPRGEGERRFQLRVNTATGEQNVPFAALIGPDQPRSGGYGGMSVVLFPSRDPAQPALISLVVGTNGLSPDEEVLGRPGHARKARAIADWLRSKHAAYAWAKQDPIRIDQNLPESVAGRLDPWKPALNRYGKLLYTVFAPSKIDTPEGRVHVRDALAALIDLFFYERSIGLMKAFEQEALGIEREWLSMTLPTVAAAEVTDLLNRRKYLVLEGPPGTGKTRLATELLRTDFSNNGVVIQFHPGTTYETFIGGLAPTSGGPMGFTFSPLPGHLMKAVLAAQASERPYLLVIDEINRTDLSKVLGEAIHLFEPGQHDREVVLAYDFPELGSTLRLPANLHILGTMNSADRSIAILDLAVRRRFAFMELWPQLTVVEQRSTPQMQQAFHDLLMIFLNHASESAFPLLPGHAYFLAEDAISAGRKLRTEVAPLLREYLRQGYVAGFASEVQAWLDEHGDSVEANAS